MSYEALGTGGSPGRSDHRDWSRAGQPRRREAESRSRRTGERWGPSHGPQGGPAFAIAVAPSAPETVYVGTGTRRLQEHERRAQLDKRRACPRRGDAARRSRRSRSTPERRRRCMPASISRWYGGMTLPAGVQEHERRADAGARSLSTASPSRSVPRGPRRSTRTPVGSAEESRLFRSTDGGRSWQPADRGLPSTYLWALAFDPTAPATVYAAMARRGIFKSSDSGARWRALGVSPAYGPVTAIAVDPRASAHRLRRDGRRRDQEPRWRA